MIRKFILVSLLSALSNINAQSVGINTENPNESAALHIAPFQGQLAKAKATISGGKLTNITVLEGGSGYSNDVEVFIAGGGPSVKNGTRATAKAIVKNGTIEKVDITNPGSEYYTAPEITFINKNNLGWILPRVELKAIDNGQEPINISDKNGDGILVYNEHNDNLAHTTFWYDTEENKWHEGVTANKTPRFNLYTFTGDFNATNLTGAGGYHAQFITSKPFKEAISNLNSVEFLSDPVVPGGYYLSLPKIPASYIIEVHLNITTEVDNVDSFNHLSHNSTNDCTGFPPTNNCSKPFSEDGYHLMGYFVEANYRKDAYNQVTATNRQEIPVVSKRGQHTVSWNFVVDVDPNYNQTFMVPFIRFGFGRMNGSTYYLPVKVLKEGSYIKVQQVIN